MKQNIIKRGDNMTGKTVAFFAMNENILASLGITGFGAGQGLIRIQLLPGKSLRGGDDEQQKKSSAEQRCIAMNRHFSSLPAELVSPSALNVFRAQHDNG